MAFQNQVFERVNRFWNFQTCSKIQVFVKHYLQFSSVFLSTFRSKEQNLHIYEFFLSQTASTDKMVSCQNVLL